MNKVPFSQLLRKGCFLLDLLAFLKSHKSDYKGENNLSIPTITAFFTATFNCDVSEKKGKKASFLFIHQS